MKPIRVEPGGPGPRLLDAARPGPGPGPRGVLVRTLRVGVGGTDHEVIADSPRGTPPGETVLVLGHEAVGVVEEPNGTCPERGDTVTPTRPPPDGSNEYFERGIVDMEFSEEAFETDDRTIETTVEFDPL